MGSMLVQNMPNRGSLGAYYGNDSLKASTLNRLASHAERGGFTNDFYYQANTGQGCAIGCSLGVEMKDGEEYEVFADTFNVPVYVGHLLENLFMNQKKRDQKHSMLVFDYMNNIPVGFKDWDKFWVLAVSALLKDLCRHPKAMKGVIITNDRDEYLFAYEMYKSLKRNLSASPRLTAERMLADLKEWNVKKAWTYSMTNMAIMVDMVAMEIEDEPFPKGMNEIFANVNATMANELAKSIEVVAN